jgi:hypothetical protein
LRRAIVLFEAYRLRVRVMLLEVQNISDVGSAPFVNRVVCEDSSGDKVMRALYVYVVNAARVDFLSTAST